VCHVLTTTKVDNIFISPKKKQINSSILAIFVKNKRDTNMITKGKYSYKFINNSLGWIAFAIASITYLLTMEPTVSLWDCGEFIATANGLEVGHPPGAPFFMIIARFFAIFAPSPDKVALMVNTMSSLASGFTILFLFWTITHFAKKALIKKEEDSSLGKIIAIMGAGMTGALAYTFSDTFWFSAVEAEVYSLSSLFTALVFWCILKWEDCSHEKHSNKWLILIAYLMGLSIGVHLLNLLAIPAIVFVYYFKKYKTTRNGIISASIISILILGIVLYGVIPGVVKIASWFELAFVNGMGLPFNSGVLFYAILLITAIIIGVRYSIKHNKIILNTIILGFTMIMIGYSSFAMIVIRSSANPTIDENNPDNVFSLLSYLNREQYGNRPLLSGNYYNAPLEEIKEGAPVYAKVGDKYKVVDHKMIYKYDSRFTTIFPRMYSSDPRHTQAYKSWGGTNGRKVTYGDQVLTVPTFTDNVKFFFSYQLGHMYFRYFMWNFAGRQNDIQGFGELSNGNWITGIPLLDNAMLGNQNELPSDMKNNKGKNKYYLFPFLLGLIGLLWQYRRGNKDFWVTLLLFFFTGIAIVLYLNQTPYQVRERDYAYAGSFYAFSIWIGLGALAIYEKLSLKLSSNSSAIIASTACLLLVPTIMACENWDDHDRSGRYATIAHAKNYLSSCEKDAILFTYGDNDTFPLWYAQNVEGIRKDIRIVNLSLLAGDWYITQMKRDCFKSKALPISFKEEQYTQGTRDMFYVEEHVKSAYDIKEILDFIKTDEVENKLHSQMGKAIDFAPTKHVFFPVDSTYLIESGQVKAKDADKMLKRLDITLTKRQYTKADMIVFDIIRENNWRRPVYFSIGMGPNEYMGLQKYFRLDGATYKIVPFASNSKDRYETGIIDTDILYDNYMNKFVWGDIKNPDVHMDEFHINTVGVIKYRSTAQRLAKKLNDEGKHDKAKAVLDRCLNELPIDKIGLDPNFIYIAEEYYNAKSPERADLLVRLLANKAYEHIRYYHSLSQENYKLFEKEEDRQIYIYKALMSVVHINKREELLKELQTKIESLYKQ